VDPTAALPNGVTRRDLLATLAYRCVSTCGGTGVAVLDQSSVVDVTAQVESDSTGDAALSVSEPRHLTNGTYTLPEPLQASFSKANWTAPVANDPVTIAFKQHINANDALRTGTDSRTLTFTLSSTTP
jgi:hypothetical protein